MPPELCIADNNKAILYIIKATFLQNNLHIKLVILQFKKL